MRNVDVAIVGAGQTGRLIAERMTTRNKQTALVMLPGQPEDYLQRLVGAIAGQPAHPPALDFPVVVAHAMPRFTGPHTLLVDGDAIEAKRFVIASGSVPNPPDAAINGTARFAYDVLTSENKPKTAIVLGAGPVGVCTAQRLTSAGTRVRLHTRNGVLPNEDIDIASSVARRLERQGVVIESGTSPLAGTEPVIVATGLRPNTAGLDLANAHVYVRSSGEIVVDEEMRTSTPHIFAAGAVTAPPFHLAFERFQAETVAANLFAPFFSRAKLFGEPFARVIPFQPPIAAIGLTEKQATNRYRDVKTVVTAWDDGLIKLVGRKRGGKLLGAHLLMPGATEMILMFDLLLRAEISLADVAESHHFPAPGTPQRLLESIEAWLAATA